MSEEIGVDYSSEKDWTVVGIYNRHKGLFDRLAQESVQPLLPFDRDDLLPIEPADRRGGLQASFEAFHRANPHILRLVRSIALHTKRRGKRIGVGAIWERLRWEYTVEVSGEDSGGYRLNNNHRAFYAQLVMATTPELEGYFETRKDTVVFEEAEIE